MGIHTDHQSPDAPHRIGGSRSSPSQSQHGTPRTRIVPGPDTTTSSLDNDPSSSYFVHTLNKRVKLERKNPTTLDLVSLPTKDLLVITRHLSPRCQVNLSLTCKIFSEKKFDHELTKRWNKSISLVECAALDQVADEMTEKERRTLYVRGSMISVYDLLLRHRAPLEFTLLLGRRIRYTKKRDKSTLTTWNCRRGGNTAVARDFVMRRGRHFARFQVRAIAPPQPGDDLHVGVIRPISRRILDSRMDEFSPFHRAMKLELLAADGKQAQEWEDGSEVQACEFISTIGRFRMTNWDEDLVPSMEEYRWNDEQNFFGSKGGFHGWAQDGLWTRSASDSSDAVIGLLLDLEQGTLSAYLDDDRIGVFSDRTLSGEYCWFATAFSEEHCQVSIERAAVAA